MAVAPTQETVNKLLDFNQKLDIGLLDTVVGTLYGGTGEQQKMAQEVLTTLKEHPDAWTKVSFLFENEAWLNFEFLECSSIKSRIDSTS